MNAVCSKCRCTIDNDSGCHEVLHVEIKPAGAARSWSYWCDTCFFAENFPDPPVIIIKDGKETKKIPSNLSFERAPTIARVCANCKKVYVPSVRYKNNWCFKCLGQALRKEAV